MTLSRIVKEHIMVIGPLGWVEAKAKAKELTMSLALCPLINIRDHLNARGLTSSTVSITSACCF
jgi:hypothetical protein